jgi:hypothetical protein
MGCHKEIASLLLDRGVDIEARDQVHKCKENTTSDISFSTQFHSFVYYHSLDLF